jgi:hypothetical protein
MRTKALEIRDEGTFIPVLAIEMSAENDSQAYLLERSGYNPEEAPLIAITTLRTKNEGITYDPYDWRNRTWHTAHLFITKNWSRLWDGDVIDVQFILGETKTQKLSERYRLSP